MTRNNLLTEITMLPIQHRILFAEYIVEGLNPTESERLNKIYAITATILHNAPIRGYGETTLPSLVTMMSTMPQIDRPMPVMHLHEKISLRNRAAG